MNSISDWATKHGVSQDALSDLTTMLASVTVTSSTGELESDAQSRIRLAASKKGILLFRNNSGAGKMDTGSFVRWGLCNDSAALNAKCKSADLIGIRKVRIGAQHVGTTIGQFVSVECKRTGWRYTGNERELAQFHWLTAIQAAGGYAIFATTPEDLL